MVHSKIVLYLVEDGCTYVHADMHICIHTHPWKNNKQPRHLAISQDSAISVVRNGSTPCSPSSCRLRHHASLCGAAR